MTLCHGHKHPKSTKCTQDEIIFSFFYRDRIHVPTHTKWNRPKKERENEKKSGFIFRSLLFANRTTAVVVIYCLRFSKNFDIILHCWVSHWKDVSNSSFLSICRSILGMWWWWWWKSSKTSACMTHNEINDVLLLAHGISKDQLFQFLFDRFQWNCNGILESK